VHFNSELDPMLFLLNDRLLYTALVKLFQFRSVNMRHLASICDIADVSVSSFCIGLEDKSDKNIRE
jgi:hypothetical protein